MRMLTGLSCLSLQANYDSVENGKAIVDTAIKVCCTRVTI